jgi:hypothetical protein
MLLLAMPTAVLQVDWTRLDNKGLPLTKNIIVNILLI